MLCLEEVPLSQRLLGINSRFFITIESWHAWRLWLNQFSIPWPLLLIMSPMAKHLWLSKFNNIFQKPVLPLYQYLLVSLQVSIQTFLCSGNQNWNSKSGAYIIQNFSKRKDITCFATWRTLKNFRSNMRIWNAVLLCRRKRPFCAAA